MMQLSGKVDYIFLRVKRSPAISTVDPINPVNVHGMSKPQTSNLKHVIIFPMKPEAEKIRIRYLYRRKILNGELNVSHSTAKRMVGPDCAYHLYGRHSSSGEEKGKRLKGKEKREKP